MGIRVTLVYSPSHRTVHEVRLTLADNASVLQALQASAVLESFPEINPATAVVGIWGRKAGLNQGLHDMDRVEIYRSLKVDPKVARRERFAKQGARTTGLFIKKRAGAKAGY